MNRNQIAALFDRDVKTIGKHINNALKEELQGIPVVANFATVQMEGSRTVKRNIEFYNLDDHTKFLLVIFKELVLKR